MKKPNTTKTRSLTDWKRVDAMKDDEIDFSDIPKLGPDFFANAILWPGTKNQLTLRVDSDVLAFFKKSGRGYQTRMNNVLRMEMLRVKASAGTRRKSANRKKAG